MAQARIRPRPPVASRFAIKRMFECMFAVQRTMLAVKPTRSKTTSPAFQTLEFEISAPDFVWLQVLHSKIFVSDRSRDKLCLSVRCESNVTRISNTDNLSRNHRTPAASEALAAYRASRGPARQGAGRRCRHQRPGHDGAPPPASDPVEQSHMPSPNSRLNDL